MVDAHEGIMLSSASFFRREWRLEIGHSRRDTWCGKVLVFNVEPLGVAIEPLAPINSFSTDITAEPPKTNTRA